ncbi:MAG: GAF domain-containing protein, partial [Actinobacteria bacterium]|nr:GAF domain-containing protein [Actinomycetota bacterium]
MDHGTHGEATHAMVHGVDPGVAVVSFVAAVVTAFVALEIAARALRAPERRRRPLLVVSGLTMGGGIWGMHFLAMLGMRTEMAMSYRLDLVVLSVLFAAAGSTVALALVAHARVTRRRLLLAASFMGLAVSAMHYTGMAALQTSATQTWDPLVVGASTVVAFVASLMALGAVASMHGERAEWSAGGRLGAAVGLGVAVAGLHYTGMAAVSFREGAPSAVRDGDLALSTSVLATVLGAAACLLLLVVTIDGARHRRRADLAGDLAVFARVSRDIGRRGDARRTVCAATEELVGCDFAMLLEPDGDGGLVVRATSSDPMDLRVDASAGSSICGDVLHSARRRFLADVRTDAAADGSAVQRTSMVSAIFEPVLLDDRPIAVLVAGWTERVESPGERRLAISGLLAAEAAVAIERADLLARLREQAMVDGLTGLPNRRALDEALDQGVRRAGMSGHPLTVAMGDVDRFQAYNDAPGPPEGDRLRAG